MSQNIQDSIFLLAKKYQIDILPHHQPSDWSLPQFKYDHYSFYKTNKPYHEYFDYLLDDSSELVLFVCHPGFVDQDIIRYSSLTLDRAIDYDMMIDKSVASKIKQKGYEIISFRDLK